MKMKQSLKSYFIDTETFLKHFLKTNGISIDQYQKDMLTLNIDAEDLIKCCKNKINHDIDIHPYIYVLNKTRQNKPKDVASFIRFLTVNYKKHVDQDFRTGGDLYDIVKFYSNPTTFLYLLAVMQYYFL